MSDLSCQPAPYSFAARPAAILARLWRALSRAQKRRVTRQVLHRLSDHTLRDIGLERDDIDRVFHHAGPGRPGRS